MTDLLSPPTRAAASPAHVRPERSLALTTALFSLASLAFLAVWFVAYVLVIGAAQEHGDQQRLFARFRSQLSQATAPLGPTSEGKPVALLDAPRGGLRGMVVVEGATSRDLQAGPGHRRDTVLPGQQGLSVLYGKGATFGAPFAHLTDLRVGDPLRVTTGQGVFTYHVTGTRAPGDTLPPSLASGAGRLTMVTQSGSGWRTGWAPTRTTYVDASLDSAAPAGAGRVAAVKAEQLMAGDTSALLPLVLWLEALLLVVVGGVWSWRRWGRWQSWVVASPVLVAVLVLTSGVAAQVMPNLL
jgi:sortase A